MSATITATDYPALKGFFAWMCDHAMTLSEQLDPEHHPIAVLDAMETRRPAMARKGLAMAIGDLMEEFDAHNSEWLARIDGGLTTAGWPSFSAVRAQFGLKVRAVLKRGIVRSDVEYYTLRNCVEAMPEPDRGAAWNMLSAFEAKA